MKFDSARYVFWLCWGATTCIAIAANLPPVFFTTFSEAFGGAAGLTDEQIGRIPAVVFGGFVVGIAVASPFADAWGAKVFVVSGLVSLVAGLGLLGCANAYLVLLAAVFLLGLGAGLMEVVLSPVVAALEPRRRATLLNWLHAAFSFGAVGTVLIGSAALHVGVSWRAATIALIAVPAVILVGFAAVRTLPLVHEEGAHEPVRQLVRHRFLWVAVVLIALGGGTELGVAQWLPAYAERSLGFTKASSAMVLAAFSVAMFAGRVVSGHWLARVTAERMMLAFCTGCVVLVLMASFAPARAMALAACIALGFGVSCFWPTSLSLASNRYPGGGASMFGMLSAVGNAGCMVVPWCVGFIAERTTLNVGIASIAVCPAAMAVILTVLMTRRNQS
ncbi:MAG: MFS transporter [Candidatus Hydrogenedentes bacterium]|nr:MFS transporter [Candidatus Hydrogenedentota bacterium]